jgi:hypothetical protein
VAGFCLVWSWQLANDLSARRDPELAGGATAGMPALVMAIIDAPLLHALLRWGGGGGDATGTVAPPQRER